MTHKQMGMAVSYKALCAKRGGLCPDLLKGRRVLVIGDWGAVDAHFTEPIGLA